MFNPQKLLWPESKFQIFIPEVHGGYEWPDLVWWLRYSRPGNPGRFLTNISASTSTPKLLLSPRPNLTPFLSRETASATKLQLHYLQSCIDRFIWSNCTFILATYSVLRNKKFSSFHFVAKSNQEKPAGQFCTVHWWARSKSRVGLRFIILLITVK